MATPSAPFTETILIVDDEVQVLALVAELLRTQGYAVMSTWDPDEALRLARAHSGPIHLLLSDLVMPVMTGHELATEICAIHPDMKVLFISGYTNDEVVRRGITSKNAAFIQKPFAPHALLQRVREVLGNARLK